MVGSAAYAITATNIANGNIAQLTYQSASGATSFVGTGTLGQLLVSAGSTSTGPVFTNTASIWVGNSTVSSNLRGGVTGSIPYQSTSDTTVFLAPGPLGYVLSTQGPNQAPIWTSAAGLSAANAATATNIANGTIGQIPYQTTAGNTAFFGPGTSGQLLVSAGSTSTGPVFTNTSSIMVGSAAYAITATNISTGTAGQLVYQTAPGITGFVSTGTAGNVLVSNGTGAPTFNNTLTLAGTLASISTTTGALQVRGGVGVGGSVYAGNRIGFVNTSNVSTVYQFYNAATNSLDTVFG